MRFAHPRITALTLFAALAIAAGAAGCGSDSSGDTTSTSISIPAVTSPIPTGTSTATAPTTTQSTTKTSKGGQTYNPTAPDSATNDIPPPAGSPQAQFEQQCRQHPSACG